MRPPSAPSGPYGGVGAWEELSPHSLRHSAITFALDAGASLRTCRTTPATTIPARPAGPITPLDSLDRNAAYTVAAYLARQHREQLRRSIGGREFIGSGFA